MKRGKPLLARWLSGRRVTTVVAENVMSSRNDLRIRVDLARRTDHPHDSPQPSERYRIEHRCRAQLRKGHTVRERGRSCGWRCVEDVVPKHRQTRGVDS